MVKHFTNAERCKRRRIKRDYELKVAEYYARGGTNQNLKLPHCWTQEMLDRRMKIINEYHPLFLGCRIAPSLLVQQIAKLLNASDKPALLYCQLGTQIVNNYDGLPAVILGMLKRGYTFTEHDLFFTPAKVLELLKNIMTINELEELKSLLLQ